jgi:sugar phosphate isomerase/epimerase
MQLGIFAKTFPRPTLEATLDAVLQHGLRCIQFNLACAGLPAMPDAIHPAVIERIQAALQSRQMRMAAVSGTFNMAHPDPQVRRDGLRRLGVLASACKSLGTSIITLCTGSRHPTDMWHWHAENATPAAWHDMLETLNAAVKIAQAEGVTLAFEPERANVVCSARLARELLARVDSPNLKVVLDPANIINGRSPAAIPDVIDDAFDLLEAHIVIAHAKDKDAADGFRAAGTGVLDYPRYLRRLHEMHFDGALVIHSLDEGEVDACVQYLRHL